MSGRRQVETRPAQPWWRRVSRRRAFGIVYVVLGVLVTFKAANGPGGTLWLLGPAFLLGGIGMLARAQSTLHDDELIVPRRVYLRRHLPIADIDAFALPHRFARTARPSAVMRSAERVFIADADDTTVQAWSNATGIPVTRDEAPTAPDLV